MTVLPAAMVLVPPMLPDEQSSAVILTVALGYRLSPSWTAKIKELVADSQKNIQMDYVRKQMANTSFLCPEG